MTRVHLAYGRGHLDLALPATIDVIEPRFQPAVPDEPDVLAAALREPSFGPPLRAVVKTGSRVAVSICDVTRPFPARRVLPVLLQELPTSHVTLFIATGTHRACTSLELEDMLGADVLRAVEVVQHDAFSGSHSPVGRIPGTNAQAFIDSEFLQHDVRLTLGFVEPHFFAGFSGGPKMVAPGLAAIDTVLELHSAERIASPEATWGVIEGNPVHDAVRAVAAAVDVAFALDVTLNRNREITAVFSGRLFPEHAAACAFARATAMAPVSAPYDAVLTTNSGYPLDQNLYQCVKGLSAAARITRQGGTIVLAAECSDGMPAHGAYAALLRDSAGPQAFLDELPLHTPSHDQWQVQIQAQILRQARVLVRSDGLTPEQIRAAWMEPITTTEEIVDLVRGLGPSARIAALPEGPQTIPYLASQE